MSLVIDLKTLAFNKVLDVMFQSLCDNEACLGKLKIKIIAFVYLHQFNIGWLQQIYFQNSELKQRFKTAHDYLCYKMVSDSDSEYIDSDSDSDSDSEINIVELLKYDLMNERLF